MANSPKKTIKHDFFSQDGKQLGQLDLNPEIFAIQPNTTLIHQVVVAQLANARKVIAHTKDRSEVSGGGRKPWRQKGTGRARHGSIRSPLWIGGGVTFGPTKERNFSQKINKKMRRKAIFMALSDRARSKQLVILDKLELKESKTKQFVAVLAALRELLPFKPLKQVAKKSTQDESGKKTSAKNKTFDIKDYKVSLLVIAADNVSSVVKAARNIPGVKVLSANSLNIVDVLGYQYLLVTQSAIAVMEQTYLKS